MKIPLKHKIYTNDKPILSLSQLTQTALESMVYEQTLDVLLSQYSNSKNDEDYQWGHVYQPHRLWCSVPTMWPQKKASIDVS